MKKLESIVKKIDYPLLAQQKEGLLDYIRRNRGSIMSDQIELLNGLVCLLDEIQDAVVEDGIKTEKEVFG